MGAALRARAHPDRPRRLYGQAGRRRGEHARTRQLDPFRPRRALCRAGGGHPATAALQRRYRAQQALRALAFHAINRLEAAAGRTGTFKGAGVNLLPPRNARRALNTIAVIHALSGKTPPAFNPTVTTTR